MEPDDLVRVEKQTGRKVELGKAGRSCISWALWVFQLAWVWSRSLTCVLGYHRPPGQKAYC